jgi:uncharacterized membrane protein YkvI
MLHLYTKAFISILPFIIPLIIIMTLVFVWTLSHAKKKQKEAMDSMKQEISSEVAARIKNSLKQ